MQNTRLTPEQIAHYRTDFKAYAQYMFWRVNGVHMLDARHIETISNRLERVLAGYITRLIINIAPRSGKTELIIKLFMSWCMGNFAHSQFIHASYSKRLATANTYAVRAIMTHEAYREIFPEVTLADDSKAKDEFRTAQGGIVYATGADGSITGYGAGSMDTELFSGAIMVDDPHKAGEAGSDVMRRNVIDWFQTTMESRKNSPDTPIIIVMQRLHEEDLAGWLLNGGNGEKWDLLKIPAITETGESFFPEKFPLDMLSRLEQANPYVFAGQYMQEPAPKDGGTIKPHMIEIVDALPAGMKYVRGWDLAATKNAGDATAGAKLGIHDGIVYIADLAHMRGSPDEVERLLVSTAQLDGKTTKQSLPQDPGQAGKAQAFSLSKKLAGHSFEFSPETGDKLTRASPLIAQINIGNARMLKAPWNEKLVHEFQMIPNGKHDDILDACSRAYNNLTQSGQKKGILLPR